MFLNVLSFQWLYFKKKEKEHLFQLSLRLKEAPWLGGIVPVAQQVLWSLLLTLPHLTHQEENPPSQFQTEPVLPCPGPSE